MEENIQTPQIQTNPILINSSSNILISFLILIIVFLGGFIIFSNPNQNQNIKLPTDEIYNQLTPTLKAIEPTKTTSFNNNENINWKIANFGMFSYEYPAGWHVGELWQENYAENGIMIAIDPNPISTAPRGGPIATFEITILNGNKNPDEILAQKKAEFNQDNYSDITQETITSSIGEIYYYKGKMKGEMFQGESVESYFFTFNQNPNDLLNQQVVVANMSLKNDQELSNMLRHIVLSFKKLTL